jgi:hypothetical protein
MTYTHHVLIPIIILTKIFRQSGARRDLISSLGSAEDKTRTRAQIKAGDGACISTFENMSVQRKDLNERKVRNGEMERTSRRTDVLVESGRGEVSMRVSAVGGPWLCHTAASQGMAASVATRSLLVRPHSLGTASSVTARSMLPPPPPHACHYVRPAGC